MTCVVYQIGLTEYSRAYNLQKKLLRLRMEGEITDTLLLLEHPPTITIGRFGKYENILASQEQLEADGISLFFTDRGGDVTYHGPGQLVAYPIINLRQIGRNIRQYIHALEEVIIRVLSSFSIVAERDQGYTGVLVKNEAVAAIGLSIKRWVSMHGFALNVNTNLEHFSLINPCGFSDKKVTSISRLLAQNVTMDVITEKLLACFSEVFETDIELRSDSDLVRCFS